MILLSNEGHTVSELCEIFKADLTTIYNRFNSWESESLIGLYDKKGKGRKLKLTPEIKEKIFMRNMKNKGKKIYIIMDNTGFHQSKFFREKTEERKEKNIEIFYLPKYSPHLNLIETLWRFMEYERIEFSAYRSWKTFVAYIEDVIINFGTKYMINFV